MRAPQVQNVDEFDRRTAPRPQPQRRENAVERILRDLLGGN